MCASLYFRLSLAARIAAICVLTFVSPALGRKRRVQDGSSNSYFVALLCCWGQCDVWRFFCNYHRFCAVRTRKVEARTKVVSVGEAAVWNCTCLLLGGGHLNLDALIEEVGRFPSKLCAGFMLTFAALIWSGSAFTSQPQSGVITSINSVR